MKLLTVLLLAGCSLMAQSQFGGYTFGAAPSDYGGLVLEIDDGDTKLYSGKSRFEDLDGPQVNLTFTKNKLTGLAIRTKNNEGDKLLSLLIAKYGEPVKKTPVRQEWRKGNLQIFYEKDKKGNDAQASVYVIKSG